MRVCVTKQNETAMPCLGDVQYSTMVYYEGHVYEKVSKDSRDGVKIEWPPGCSLLFNLNNGAIRAVRGSTCVKILRQANDLKACIVTDPRTMLSYIKSHRVDKYPKC